jgi:hypothetical protein
MMVFKSTYYCGYFFLTHLTPDSKKIKYKVEYPQKIVAWGKIP